jgi:hypothetical protein
METRTPERIHFFAIEKEPRASALDADFGAGGGFVSQPLKLNTNKIVRRRILKELMVCNVPR